MKILFFVIHCFFVGSISKKYGPWDHLAETQDQTSPRANTLFDDPDDIQKQLDREAQDRNKFGKYKTVWVFHLATEWPTTQLRSFAKRDSLPATIDPYKSDDEPDVPVLAKNTKIHAPWDYKDQNKWAQHYPACSGSSQSPVDLPYSHLQKTKGARQMVFKNYDTLPKSMWLYNDGRTTTLYGNWARSKVPVIYGGAAHNRCYLFHSMAIHWPSEHAIGKMLHPLETQALFISSLYRTMDQAIDQSNNDPLAFLTISTIYTYGNCSHKGTYDLINAAIKSSYGNNTLNPAPFRYFNPTFNEYAVYHGSLSQPPCTEAVLWLIRAKSLPITRNAIKLLQDRFDAGDSFLRQNTRRLQPKNDRPVFMFRS